MTKQEIIEVLAEARQAYSDAIADTDNDDRDFYYKVLMDNDLHKGLCAIIKTGNSLTDEIVIEELFKDLPSGRFYKSSYWYKAPSIGYAKDYNRNGCLQPRLDHLNRTIERLQKEIAA